jgi:hypothetical protein
MVGSGRKKYASSGRIGFISRMDAGAYPQRPHPKDAVNKMLNTTSPIIHQSSLFMVGLLVA